MLATQATYKILYNGKNITADILPYVISFTYSDKESGQSDELEIVLEDSDGIWRLDWYPQKGDKISAQIDNFSGTLNCGTFTIDEVSGEGSLDGDTVTIKALAAGINKQLRTRNSFAHESKSLREIANTVASKHGLTVVGNISNVVLQRATQAHETDLHFLRRIAGDYGYTFSVRDSKLIFTNIFELEDKDSALTIHRNEITSYSINDKTSQTFNTVKLSYHNPSKKKVISHEITETAAAFSTVKQDVLQLHVRADNQQQAEIKAKVALYRANSLQQEGSLEMPGNIFAQAGNNMELVGLGYFSGKYYINSSTHTVNKDGGFTTGIEIKRVGLLDKSKER